LNHMPKCLKRYISVISKAVL